MPSPQGLSQPVFHYTAPTFASSAQVLTGCRYLCLQCSGMGRCCNAIGRLGHCIPLPAVLTQSDQAPHGHLSAWLSSLTCCKCCTIIVMAQSPNGGESTMGCRRLPSRSATALNTCNNWLRKHTIILHADASVHLVASAAALVKPPFFSELTGTPPSPGGNLSTQVWN